MKTAINVIYFFVSAAFLFAALSSCGRSDQPASPAIVIMGDERLTLDDLRSSIPMEMTANITKADFEDYVNRWIDSHILYQKGLDLGLEKNPDIQRRVREFEIRLIGAAYLDSTLETKIIVTPQEISKYYEENKDIFVRSKQEIHLKHLLLEDKATSDDLYRKLRRNQAEFDTLLVQYNSHLPEDERDLGYVSEDDVAEIIWSKVKNYRNNAIVQPIKTDFGYHIFKVLDKQEEGSIKELDDVKIEIEARLRQQKLEENYTSLLTQLKASVKIETYFDLLNRIPLDSIVSRNGAEFARGQ